jgi:hypothetical protein
LQTLMFVCSTPCSHAATCPAMGAQPKPAAAAPFATAQPTARSTRPSVGGSAFVASRRDRNEQFHSAGSGEGRWRPRSEPDGAEARARRRYRSERFEAPPARRRGDQYRSIAGRRIGAAAWPGGRLLRPRRGATRLARARDATQCTPRLPTTAGGGGADATSATPSACSSQHLQVVSNSA